MKILITGGAGFIGSNLTNFLLRNYNCKIVVVDNLLNGDLSRLDKSNRLEIITESVLNIDAYAKHLNDSDFIFHLACIQISKSNNIPNIDLETNAISTLNILDYLQYDTTTTIYEMNESESEFPTVSFCSADYDPIFDIKIIKPSRLNEITFFINSGWHLRIIINIYH